MSKAILVMDMPISCLECPLRYKSEEMPLGNFTYQSLFRCEFEPEDLCEDDGDTVYLNDIMMKSKPDWCPLKPMPNIKCEELCDVDDWYDSGYHNGYNSCIDELLSEKE